MNDARTITHALGGRWFGGGYGTAPCPAHDDRRPSLSLRDGRNGRLLAHCFAGCDWTAVLDALRARGLLDGGGKQHVEPQRTRFPASENAARSQDARDAARRAAQAERCWIEAGPVAGTLAERYLRRRGITCPLGDALRFHPTCWHGPSARRHPAMVARVEGADGFAVHRTYLAPGGGKALVEPAKMMLGACAGGAVRLVGGHGRLVVAEGIETALSLASGLLDGPASVCAALSAPGMAALRLHHCSQWSARCSRHRPDGCSQPSPDQCPDRRPELIVAADGDRAGREAAHALARRAAAEGWRVLRADPGDGLDFNDLLTGRAAA